MHGTTEAHLVKMTAQLKRWGTKMGVVKTNGAHGEAGILINYCSQDRRSSDSVSKQALKQQMRRQRAAAAEGCRTMEYGPKNAWSQINILIYSQKDK